MYRPTQTTTALPIPPKGGSSADRENRTMNDMHEIRYEDIRELAKIASENNVEITLTVNEEGLSVNIEKSRSMSITTTTESEE